MKNTAHTSFAKKFSVDPVLEEGALGNRKNSPVITPEVFERLKSFGDQISFPEAQRVYSQLSSFLAQRILALANEKPFVIGITGSVAVGKSTTARLLSFFLAQEPYNLRVVLVPTDGFLLPMDLLRERNLIERKGFPESFDNEALHSFLKSLKEGKTPLRAPVYSHELYDIVPHCFIDVDNPDIVLLEGLNILSQTTDSFVDFSIYIDAHEADIEAWYVKRFLDLRENMKDPQAYFHKFAYLSDSEARTCARKFWHTINLPNLYENILPAKCFADMILKKDHDHSVASILLSHF